MATRIFARAGVNLVWATGNDKADAEGLHVRVQLVPSDMATQQIKKDGLTDTVFGWAARDAGRAYIFPHRIASLALRHSDDFRQLLGLILAHELGHLVLPPHSHSDDGIMRANIGARSKSNRDFTAEQGVAIRSMLTSVSALPAPRSRMLRSRSLATEFEFPCRVTAYAVGTDPSRNVL